MRRTIAAIGSPVFGAGAIVAGGAPATAAIEGDRFQVVSRSWDEHYEDAGRKGPSIGDTFTFTEKLFHRGKRVGRDSVHCETTRATRREFSFQCQGTFEFGDRGSISAAGAITYRRGDRSRFSLAITGGTGEWSGASGEIRPIDRRGEPPRIKFILE